MFHHFQSGFNYFLICFCESYFLLFSVVFHSSIQRMGYVDIRSHFLCPKDI